jgi:5-methylcytosine-specific restriction endonuclease McrA
LSSERRPSSRVPTLHLRQQQEGRLDFTPQLSNGHFLLFVMVLSIEHFPMPTREGKRKLESSVDLGGEPRRLSFPTSSERDSDARRIRLDSIAVLNENPQPTYEEDPDSMRDDILQCNEIESYIGQCVIGNRVYSFVIRRGIRTRTNSSQKREGRGNNNTHRVSRSTGNGII